MPHKIMQICKSYLAHPLSEIFNTCLKQHVYPEAWKLEYVTPIQKCPQPKKISDLRKISLTSQYSKLFEGFLKDWILEDIKHHVDPSQYGARKGSGTEHLIVAYVDRVLKSLDSVRQRSAVIAAAVDWSAAFDRLDPTLTVQKMIKIGIRPSLIPVLISYMSQRRMIVKFKGVNSAPKDLIGGGPQGTILGGLQYNISNDDCCREEIDKLDRYKYFDDLNILEFLILSDQLTDYDVKYHVPSDVGIGQPFLSPSKFETQQHLNYISDWTRENLMLLNEKKSSYIVYSRAKSEFSTRLTLNGTVLERQSVIKILGLWIQEDLKWDFNT